MNRPTLFTTPSASVHRGAMPLRPVIDLASGQVVSLDLRDMPGTGPLPMDDTLFQEIGRLAGRILPGHVSLSVMVDCRLSREADFPGRVAQALKRQGVAPDRLTLFFQDQHCLAMGMAALDMLIAFKRRGFLLGLDIESLDLLPSLFVERLPVDILRLDPLDIMDVAGNIETAALAGQFVAYAGNLLMRTAARGVRHENQLAVLKHLGFSLGQGPYFAMPSLPDALPSPSPSERKDASEPGRPS